MRRKIAPETFFSENDLRGHLGSIRFEQVKFEFEKATDRKLPFHLRLEAFLTGRTAAGRRAGQILDIITIFLPYQGKINQTREMLSSLLYKQQNPNRIMKKLKETSTKTALITLAALVAIVVGVDSATLQGLVQDAWVAVVALIAAVTQIFELFRKEPVADD